MKSFLVLLISVGSVKAQIAITIPGVASSLVKTEMLWNFIIINQNEEINGNVQLTLTDVNGNVLYIARSSTLIITKGAKTFFYNQIQPETITLNKLDNKDQWLKVGKYMLCYTLTSFDKGDNILAQECAELNVEPFTPPLIMEPANNSSIHELYPNFSWQQPSPPQIFNNLRYEIKLVKLASNQIATDAIKTNSPIFFDNNLSFTNKMLPNSVNALEFGESYVWQITAYDNNYSIKSELAQFKIIKDSILSIIDKSPFLEMGIQTVPLGIMHDGYIKILINNNTGDSIAKLCLVEIGQPNCIITGEVKLGLGQNFIVKPFTKTIKLNTEKIYELYWINSHNERFAVKFKPVYHK